MFLVTVDHWHPPSTHDLVHDSQRLDMIFCLRVHQVLLVIQMRMNTWAQLHWLDHIRQQPHIRIQVTFVRTLPIPRWQHMAQFSSSVQFWIAFRVNDLVIRNVTFRIDAACVIGIWKWIQARIVEDCSAESTPSSVCDIVVFYIKGALVCVCLQCRCYQYCIIIIQAIAIKMKFYQGWIGDQTICQDSFTFGFYSISSSSTRPQLLQLLPVTVTIDSRKFRRLTPSDGTCSWRSDVLVFVRSLSLFCDVAVMWWWGHILFREW